VTLNASFGFATIEAMLDVQIQLARKRIASECNGFDPFYNEVMKGLGFNFEPTKPVLRNRYKLSSRFTSASMPSIRFRLKEQWPLYATAARAMASNSEARFPPPSKRNRSVACGRFCGVQKASCAASSRLLSAFEDEGRCAGDREVFC
jgi:hypothetical protein